MNRTLVINCVGLSPKDVGENTPNIAALARDGFVAPLEPVLPAVTCSVQSTMLTGAMPRDHGIVGNGWYFRDLSEVWLWRQSNRLVQGDKVWDRARRRDPTFTVCNMFWWYNMYADVDSSLTPRPLYFADGRKMPGVYGRPLTFRRAIEERLGEFPLFNFWGPAADIRSSDWIADATRLAMELEDPTLTLAYIPHLDYDLQRLGPNHPAIAGELRRVDACVGRLIEAARASGREVLVVSEYGITEVEDAVAINVALRQAGFLETVPMLDRENLDPGASRAFAVADHQIAHVYVRDQEDIPAVRRVLEPLDGVEAVLGRDEQAAVGLDHDRAGELVAVATRDRWFSYYFWEDEAEAPDYARTVDIHRKPGYDPVELFLDPALKLAKLKIGTKVLRKKLGFRMLMDVIPLTPRLVRGSHGRLPDRPDEGAVLVSSRPARKDGPYHARDVADLILETIFEAD